MPAPDSVAGTDVSLIGHLLIAERRPVIAARRELAAARPVVGIGSGPADGVQDLALALSEDGNGPQKRDSIGMSRPTQHVVDGSALDDVPHVHDDHFVGQLGDDAHVVRNEEYRRTVLVLEPRHEAEDLGLGGDVEGRRGFVGDEYLGIAGHRHRYHGPLSHASGKLVRIFVDPLFRKRNPHVGEERKRLLPPLARVHGPVVLEILLDLEAYRVHGIERRHGVLENHGDIGAPQSPHFFSVSGEGVDSYVVVASVVDNFARFDSRQLRQQLRYRCRRHAFPAARLAHHAEGLPLPDGEGNVVDRLVAAAVGVEKGLEVLHRDQSVVVHRGLSFQPCCDGSAESRSPSPMKFTLSTNRDITMPTGSQIHQ